MPRSIRSSVVFSALVATAFQACATQATILHVFGGKQDGSQPTAPMIAAADGSLYGTTSAGGTHQGGTVFRLVPPPAGQTAWTEQILFDFAGVNAIHESATGSAPRSALWFGDDGSVFGTTSWGSPVGAGNVFQLSPPADGSLPWAQSVITTFQSGAADAGFPEGAAVPVGDDGTRFGTSVGGGPANEGTVYALTPPAVPGAAWEESLVATFLNTPDGGGPVNDLVADAQGRLYGTATIGGAHNFGAIFQLSPPALPGGAWTKTLIYSFTGGRDGRDPGNQLAIDASGVLWGAMSAGGKGLEGSLFTLTPPTTPGGAWTFADVHDFADDGAQGGLAPSSGLVADGHGAFYGVTGDGGPNGCGTVYRFKPGAHGAKGKATTLHAFAGGNGGAFPTGNLLLAGGVLYGTTFGSTSADGDPCDGASVAFRVAP